MEDLLPSRRGCCRQGGSLIVRQMPPNGKSLCGIAGGSSTTSVLAYKGHFFEVLEYFGAAARHVALKVNQ